MKSPLRVLSLGAGVQSTTVLLMSCRGLLPRLDAAVFADTQWEPREVYEHLGWLEAEAANAGIPVYRVTNGRLRDHTVERFVLGRMQDQHYASLPLHVLNADGSRSIVRRQCTYEFKVLPIERFIRRELLGLRKGEHASVGSAEQWFGISADEMRRVRLSSAPWKTHVYPLVGLPHAMLDRPYTRLMCLDWLRRHYPDQRVPRSACIGCPFRSNEEWRRIRADPQHWADATEVDRAIRRPHGMDGQVFLHRDCRPLDEVDLRTDAEKGQLEFGFRQECLGYCGN